MIFNSVIDSIVDTKNYYCKKYIENYNQLPPAYDIAKRVFKAFSIQFGSTAVLNAAVNIAIKEEDLLLYKIAVVLFFFSIAREMAYSEIIHLNNDWKSNILAEDQSKKDVLLCCRPSHIISRCYEAQINKLEEMYSKTHSIKFVKVGNIADINHAIEDVIETGGKISALWMNIHREDRDLLMIDDTEINESLEITKINYKNLNDDAKIILGFCDASPLTQKKQANDAKVLTLFDEVKQILDDTPKKHQRNNDSNFPKNLQQYCGPNQKCMVVKTTSVGSITVIE